MASPGQQPGSWASCVVAQDSSVNVPASNTEAAGPFGSHITSLPL